MKIMTIVKGASLLAVTGGVCYMVSKAPKRKQKCLKRDANRAIRAVNSMVHDFQGMM